MSVGPSWLAGWPVLLVAAFSALERSSRQHTLLQQAVFSLFEKFVRIIIIIIIIVIVVNRIVLLARSFSLS